MALRPTDANEGDDAPREAARSSAKRAPVRARTSGEGPRTRGGWTPAGTAAERRAIPAERVTSRGERRRRELMDAARRVFERDGYLDVGVADIVKEAGIAHGSFYTYFPSKMEVFRAVTAEVAELVDRSILDRPKGDAGLDAVEELSRANLRYVEIYRQNARIYALLEQLGHMDDDLHRTLLERRRRHIERVRDRIRRWQAQGLADPGVDAASTAVALISMISNVCSWLFVEEDAKLGGSQADQVVATVNGIWIRAVDLRSTPEPAWL